MRMRYKKVACVLLSLAMASVSLTSHAVVSVTRGGGNTVNQMATEPELVYVNTLYGTERTQNIDEHWRFYLGNADNAQSVTFNDSQWREVNLPHDYSIEQDYTKSGEAESGYLPGGTGWYRKSLVIPANMQGKRLRLDFGGVYMNATVWINGKQLGTHPYGYTSFSYDITDHVNFGSDNVIAVKVDNQIPSSRWYSGSGIYRSVSLTVTDPVHVDLYGTKVTTPNLEAEYQKGPVQVHVDTRAANDSTENVSVILRHSIYEKGSDTVKAVSETEPVQIPAGTGQEISSIVEMNNPSLWTVADPKLYEVRTEILKDSRSVDTYSTEFGFRWFRLDPDTGFSLNGENMKLKGVCMHHDQGALGSAAYERAMERQVGILKEMGCNSIRVTHNPADENLIKICNEQGILLIEEAFDTWIYSKNGNTNDYARWFNRTIEDSNTILGGIPGSMTWAEFDTKAMVRRDRNAPSVIMWSMGNELMEGFSGNVSDYPAILNQMIAWVKEEDATRAVTTGENKLKANWSEAKAMGNNLAEAGGSVGFNYTAGGQLDQYHRDYPQWPMYGSETASAINSRGVYNPNGYNGSTQKGLQLTSYDKSAVGWGHVASDAWYTVVTRNYMAGEYVWTGFDYIGEPTPWNGTGSGAVTSWPSPKSSYFGIIDTAGFPKDSYYLYQSLWNDEVSTLHILPAWNSSMVDQDANGKVKVIVYTDAASVELFYISPDGVRQSQGKKTFTKKYTQDNLYSYQIYEGDGKSGVEHENLYLTFDVPYADGTLEAVAYDVEGEVVQTTQVSTTGQASSLKLSADRDSITAGGKDLSYITVDVLDENGNLVPYAENRIRFTVEGNGELIGVDNGSSPDHDSYQSDNRKAFGGKALAIVRSEKEAGSFTVKAESEGLRSGSVTVTVNPVETPDTPIRVDSYFISKNYYVKTGNEPVLPDSLTVRYTDGTQAVMQAAWDKMNQEDIGKAGSYSLYGTLENGLKVSVNINMVDEIAALLNYSTAVVAGSVPALPDTRPAVMEDGAILDVQFPVRWEETDAALFDQPGIFVVHGLANVFGKELSVTAAVRVSEQQIVIGNNVAKNYLTLKQNIPEAEQSDNLMAIVDGSIKADPNYGGGKNESVWTDWQYAQNGNRNPEITFTYATAQNLGQVKLYFFTDSASARLPEKVELLYSLDPSQEEGWKKINASLETGKTSAERVTCYTYTFTPVSAVGFQIAVTDSGEVTGTGTKPCTGITEAELYTAQGSFSVGSTAKLERLQINDEVIEGASLLKESYATPASVINNLEVVGEENAAVTILPVYNQQVKLLIESEDHNKRGAFTIFLDADPDDLIQPDDESMDYPWNQTVAEAPNFENGYPSKQAVDHDNNTMWHTLWSRVTPETDRWLMLTLEEETSIQGLRYLPKQGTSDGDSNGRVGTYQVEVSTNKTDWELVSEGVWEDTPDWKLAVLKEPVNARYVRLRGITTYGSGSNANKFMNAAEVRVRKARIAEDISNGQLSLEQTEFVENGAPVMPSAVVSVGGNILREGIDYKLTYQNNIRPGTATVTAVGILKYKGTLTTEFTIKAQGK